MIDEELSISWKWTVIKKKYRSFFYTKKTYNDCIIWLRLSRKISKQHFILNGGCDWSSIGGLFARKRISEIISGRQPVS